MLSSYITLKNDSVLEGSVMLFLPVVVTVLCSSSLAIAQGM